MDHRLVFEANRTAVVCEETLQPCPLLGGEGPQVLKTNWSGTTAMDTCSLSEVFSSKEVLKTGLHSSVWEALWRQ